MPKNNWPNKENKGGEGMSERKESAVMDLFADDIITFLHSIARGEYEKPEVAFNDIEERIFTLFDRNNVSGELRDLVRKKIDEEVARSASSDYSIKFKKAASEWLPKLFGIEVAGDNVDPIDKKTELILDNVVSDLENTIRAESDPSKVDFRKILKRLMPADRGRMGSVMFVQMMKRIPDMVQERLNKRMVSYRLDKVEGMLNKLKQDIEDVIKEETGPYNN